ncbi:phosphonopyruvate decarboxylase [Silanimonas sp.]|jgi:phosphonopyruvate decarboxylase|uniref:phosphonopyruvate decarboxylase n=1 Tax=Silanimonas sp. TaxID=1929290 RepID=UPI0022C4ABA9|nr:phosphonopyruvate decarboxylase [Silanimonas sp.]MCZ8167488.1 phosphonopyruvate decarboxylase [Silanimonas sp.]
MIPPEKLYRLLQSRGIGLFAGVPDSLLANFCAYVDDNGEDGSHVITANEGNAVALAAGYHMATGKFCAVYMQNSGLGNAINPLTSLADPEVYRLPMLLIIGWRGEPGVKDEPQHVKQGRVTLGQLELLGVPCRVLEAGSDAEAVVDELFADMARTNAPVALVVRKDTFAKYKSLRKAESLSDMTREQALDTLLALTGSDDLIISTTGKTSREVFELRVRRGEAQRDFLTVGGMGHTSSIALGVALGQPKRRVVCLDGDGSLLMHLGAMPVIGSLKPARLIHVLLNNAAHESVGGQPTAAGSIDFAAIALGSGYAAHRVAGDPASLRAAWRELVDHQGPVLLEVRIKAGSRDDLGRPTSSAEENKRAFMGAALGTAS